MISLRFKIIISTLLIGSLIIIGSYLLIQDIQAGIIENEFREKGFLLANNLALEVTNPVLVNDPIEIKHSIDALKDSYTDIEYIYVTDSEGIVLAHTFENGFPKALQKLSEPSSVMKEHVLETERGIIHEFDASLFKNTGYVHIGVSENSVREKINEASRKLLLLAISAVFLGGIFIYFTGRRLTEPILRLTEGAKKINNGVLNQKIEIDSSDELGVLAKTFNDMASSLDKKIRDLVLEKERTETAERYLETLFDRIEDGIIVLNRNHEIIRTNESFLRMIGMSQEQVLGKSCHEVIFGDNPSSTGELCSIDTMLHTGKPVRTQHEIRINDHKKIMEIGGSIFSDSKGEINFILVLRDVTSQKMLEEEIIARNKELTILNEISKNITETFDLDIILSKALENLLKLTGMEYGDAYIFDESSGEFVLKIHSGMDANPIPMNTLKHIMKINEVSLIEGANPFIGIPLRSKEKVLGMITLGDGAQGIPIKNRELFTAVGNQIGISIENILFYNNIKNLKEFNEEILNNVDLAIHVIDTDMKILAVNNELLVLSRGMLKKEQMINRNLYDVYPFLKEKNVDKEYEYVLKTGEIFHSEDKTEFYGEVIFTSTSKIPIKDRNGNVEKIITVMKDISDRKRLEEELKDSYEELRLTYLKLKELYKVKDAFLSGMSHDLRTPLTAIIGYTELLLEQNITSEQRNELEIILRNAQRLSGLINGLLDTALIESRALSLDIQTLPLRDIISHAAEDLSMMAAIKNIPINIEVPQRVMVRGDRDRLGQVFSNVLDNAIKFTIKGSIKISAEEENEWVHVKIDDTGIGIPQERLEKIFDMFYQLDTAQTQKYGAGLGLWISKSIVEAHKGKIWAESKNSGSTFHVLIANGNINE